MISGRQIAAARALLKWTQKTLADKARLSVIAIKKIEAGDSNPRESSVVAIIEAVRAAGVEFTQNGGVEYKKDYLTILEGDDAFLKLLDDVYHTMKNNERYDTVYFGFAKNSLSPPEVVESQLRIRRTGVKFKFLVMQGDNYLRYPFEEYRMVPEKHFINLVQVIYAEKCAFAPKGNLYLSIFEDKQMAAAQRSMFLQLWDIYPKPQRSIADKTYS